MISDASDYSAIDSATCFGPKFGHGVIDCPAAGGIVRDDKAIASLNADSKEALPASVGTPVNQELLAFREAESQGQENVQRRGLTAISRAPTDSAASASVCCFRACAACVEDYFVAQSE